MAEGDPQTPAATVDPSFGNEPKGSPVNSCPTWIELRFEPKPARPLPNGPGPASGEQTFLHRYKYKLSVGGTEVKNGVLDMRRGSVIRADGVPCGSATITIDFPKYEAAGEGVVVVWRKQWQNKFTIKKLQFDGLATGQVHYFDIINEVPAVAEYMAREMNTNAKSGFVGAMKPPNDAAHAGQKYVNDIETSDMPWYEKIFARMGQGEVMRGAAINSAFAQTTWFALVHTDGPWDHKKVFREQKIGETVPGAWHTWGEWEYFYDPWSNIHYGYVGRAAGFTHEELLSGADMQQQIDDGSRSTGGDPPQDKISIKIGMDLYDQQTPVTAELLIQKIESSTSFDRRPHGYTSAHDTPTVKKRSP